jgi:hypothetical protein
MNYLSHFIIQSWSFSCIEYSSPRQGIVLTLLIVVAYCIGKPKSNDHEIAAKYLIIIYILKKIDQMHKSLYLYLDMCIHTENTNHSINIFDKQVNWCEWSFVTRFNWNVLPFSLLGSEYPSTDLRQYCI